LEVEAVDFDDDRAMLFGAGEPLASFELPQPKTIFGYWWKGVRL